MFNYDLQQPFEVIVNMSGVPLGCSQASLFLSVYGDVANLNHRIQLRGEDNAFLGARVRIFYVFGCLYFGVLVCWQGRCSPRILRRCPSRTAM